MWSQDTYTKAFQFAAKAHGNQKVPGSGFPYIYHVSLVCMEVMAACVHEQEVDMDFAIQCALLHDVLEDTETSESTIKDIFGDKVCLAVKALTKDNTLEKSNQMTQSLRAIERHSKEVWMVKMADRIVNLAPPPSMWNKEKIKNYYYESILIYDHLKSSCRYLADRFAAKIDVYKEYVKP